MLLLALAAAAAQEPSNESPRVHLASFAFGKPYTDTLEWYREHARSLGFAGALLWGREELESDPLFASSLAHLVDLQKGTRPYCAGFKSLMLHRSLERSREGDYVMWADASRHFDYTNRNLTGLDVNAAVTRLRRDGRTNVYGFVMCKGVGPTKRKKSLPHCCKRDDVVDGNCRDKPRPVDSTLSRVAELSPALLAFFPPNVSAHLEKPEINTAHLLLQNNRETRGLVKEFLRYYIQYPSAKAICRSAPNDQALWNLLGVVHDMQPVNINRHCSKDCHHKDFLAVLDELGGGRYEVEGGGG